MNPIKKPAAYRPAPRIPPIKAIITKVRSFRQILKDERCPLHIQEKYDKAFRELLTDDYRLS